MTVALLLALAMLQTSQTPAPTAQRIHFGVAAGTTLLKVCRTSHELQIDSLGASTDDMPVITDRTGGWVSSSQRIDFLDEYMRCDDARAVLLRRGYVTATSDGRLDATLAGAKQLSDKSHSQSPLIGQTVLFTWIPEERDWSRCFDRVDAEEEWLAGLRGEYDLLALLPPQAVLPGEQWEIDLTRLREVFAPGGDLSMIPSGGSLFGRTMELGVGGDFADFLAEPPQGRAHATFSGVRDLPLESTSAPEPPPPTEPTTQPPRTVRMAAIALEFDLTSQRDRTDLYRMAMPADERAEAARLESVPLEYTLNATGELLWNLEAGHFHSLSIKGRESYFTQVLKTQFVESETHKYAQQSRFSGTLTIDVQCRDGSNVPPPIARDNPQLKRRR